MEEKAKNIVIDGFHRAYEKGCKIRLLVVGDGPDFERMKEYAAQLGSRNVIFAGSRPADQVADYYRSADFFVSASISETQGMTFVEAMAAGLPLLARKDIVLENLLIDGETGWYFKDAEDLSNRLIRMEQLSDADFASLQERVLEQIRPLSAEVFYEKALAVYERAISIYEHMLFVEDVQVKGDIVQLYLVNMKHDTSKDMRLLMTLDDYYNEGIRKGMRLSAETAERIQHRQDAVKAWQSCMKRIAVKDRTRKEIYDWLTRNTPCDIETINGIVEKLESKGYIDDERYCAENISKMKIALLGRDRISRELRKKGIPAEMIASMLEEAPDTESEDAMMFAKKTLHSLPDSSVRMKQNKLKSKLIAKGYSSEIADSVIAQIDFRDDQIEELDNLRRCAAKAKKRYEKKYAGTKLRNTVYRYCSAQGYNAEDIYVILDEMEWE